MSHIQSLNCDGLTEFLIQKGIKEDVCQILKNNEVDGQAFLGCEEDHFEKMGIKLGIIVKLHLIQKSTTDQPEEVRSDDNSSDNSRHHSICTLQSSNSHLPAVKPSTTQDIDVTTPQTEVNQSATPVNEESTSAIPPSNDGVTSNRVAFSDGHGSPPTSPPSCAKQLQVMKREMDASEPMLEAHQNSRPADHTESCDTDKVDVSDLDVAGFATWLSTKQFSEKHCKAFKDNDVDGHIFLELGRVELKEIVELVGTVRRLQNLQQEHIYKKVATSDAQRKVAESDSMHSSSDPPNIPQKGKKTPFVNFLKRLKLLEKYPQKLKLMDAITIHWKILNKSSVSIEELHFLPYLLLQKIMMYYDYREISKIMSTKIPDFQIHPMDILLTLLHCCDNTLRQNLLSRLLTCQLAIPFLLPHPNNKTVTFLLWAMRSIVCKWKCKIGSAITSNECCIVDHKGPIISFVRIGTARSPKDFSKSSLLNTIIGDQKYFFHWNCPGGNFSRKFVDGLVELICYLPSGKESDSFSNAVTFLNLRGEARDHAMQVEFLKYISCMVFVMILDETLNHSVLNFLQQLSTPRGEPVLVFPDYAHVCSLQNSSGLVNVISEKNITVLDIKGKNEDAIKSEIHTIISLKLDAASTSDFHSLSQFTKLANDVGIRVDEDDKECTEGYSLANNVIEILNSVTPTDAKAAMLPLQGPDLWHKWVSYDKASYHRPNTENVTVAHFNQTIEQNKEQIRQAQYNSVMHSTPMMKCFIKGLKSSVRIYFLQWLKLLLDMQSRKTLPGMRMEYDRIRAELQKLRRNGESGMSTVENFLINALKKQNQEIIDGSVGLEHFFRELGQMYEAVKHHTNQKHAVDCYPIIMVDILNHGYPVELMDGDASHVPITWVSAVLDQLKRCHDGKKAFVVSVVGVQSTGKSTLLNTLFGLQLNVSAGRCTKGAFLQLIPVSNKNCDFVIIVDTEGLRAPELSCTEASLHDNQLATYAIGLADVAIINIYGEAPGDLTDILQTAVHAFIRMKNIDLNLSCHFVHQNVTAILADTKLRFGEKTFQDKLNEATKYAAIAEQCENKFSSFQDVINFDETKDITCFPGLWKGDPPMAPVNSGYTDKALGLKLSLLELADNRKSVVCFNNFQLLVETLWTAVCRENYIFSFKNTLEVTAYNELDAEFSQWSWELHRKMLEWQFEAGNAISNCPSDQISITAEECLKKADAMLQETYTNLVQQMAIFFEKSPLSETLAQWKSRYTIRLQHLNEDSKIEAKKQCRLLELNREGHLKLENIKKQHRQQLLEEITDLVSKDKKRLTHKDLERKFDEKWNLWIAKFPTEEYQRMYASNDKVEIDIFNVLQELLVKFESVLLPKLQQCKLSVTAKYELIMEVDSSKHLSNPSEGETVSSNIGIFKKVATFFHVNKQVPVNSLVKLANKVSEEFFVTARSEFCKIKRNFRNFDRAYAYDLQKKFIDSIYSYNRANSNMFTPEYIVDMALIHARYLTAEFIKLMEEVREKSDPLISFKRLRSTYLNTFLAQYKDVSGDEVAAGNLCKLLAVAIEGALCEKLPARITDHMKASCASFNQKKLFKVKILQDLAKKKNFELFKVYLLDIKGSFEWWAKQYVKEFCTEDGQLKTIVRPIVHEIIVKVHDTINSKTLNTDKPIRQWLGMLHNSLSKTLKVDLCEIQDIIVATRVKSSNKFFRDALTERLTLEEDKILKIVDKPDSKYSDITTWSKSPHLLLCDHLVGCSEQCPFCGEQCELTDSNHVLSGKDHFIHIHRPQCLGRYIRHVSKELALDLCTCSVESNHRFRNHDTNKTWVPYKNYKTLYKTWYISNHNPHEAPKYWQWFVYQYLDKITNWLGAAPTLIDHLNWGAVSEEMALASLSKIYKTT